MKTVRLVHPASGGVYDAPESAVPHWRSSGWVPATEVESPAEEIKQPAGEQDEAPRRRRATRKEED